MTQDQPARLIIIRGLPGVGKTTVSAVLRDRLAPAVRISIDTIRYLAWPRDLTLATISKAEIAAADLAISYVRQGATAIVEGVMTDRIVLDTMLGQARSAGMRPIVVTLGASLDDVLQRNAARDPYLRLPAERIRHLFDGFDQGIGERIATEELSAEETADNIIQHLHGLATRANPRNRLIIVMRHGAADVDHDRYPDHDAMGLSEAGRQQVHGSVPALSTCDIGLVVSSTLPRARQTAGIIASRLQLPVTFDDRLRERTLPALYGRPYADIATQYGAQVAQALRSNSDHVNVGDCERLDQAAARALAALDDIAAKEHDRVLVVTHGGPHAWMVARGLGVPLPDSRRITIGHARLSCLDHHGVPLALNISASDLPGLLATHDVPT
jgi:broad specificity phosphatase PhoE/predicted kinase